MHLGNVLMMTNVPTRIIPQPSISSFSTFSCWAGTTASKFTMASKSKCGARDLNVGGLIKKEGVGGY